MEDTNTKIGIKYAWYIALALVVCVIIALVLVGTISKERDQIRHQYAEAQQALAYYKLQENDYKATQAVLEVTTKELDKLKIRLENVKNQDDLLRRDIELYIKSRYRRVSRIIAKTIAENVISKSRDHNISPELVVGIIEVESSFNPLSVSKLKTDPARGLMQVRAEFWGKKIGVENRFALHDIDVGIESGIKVFNIHLKEEKGNISKALYKYVGKDTKYVSDVYYAMGKFVTFRSTVDNQVDCGNGNGTKIKEETEKVNESESEQGTENHNQ